MISQLLFIWGGAAGKIIRMTNSVLGGNVNLESYLGPVRHVWLYRTHKPYDDNVGTQLAGMISQLEFKTLRCV